MRYVAPGTTGTAAASPHLLADVASSTSMPSGRSFGRLPVGHRGYGSLGYRPVTNSGSALSGAAARATARTCRPADSGTSVAGAASGDSVALPTACSGVT